MKYEPKIHHRRSIRLAGYDYSRAGLYFITICTQNRLCLFGNVNNDDMILNDAGKMIAIQWLDLKQRFIDVDFGEYIVMPNHFHGIIVGAPLVGAQNRTGQPNTGQPQGIAPTTMQNTVGDIVGVFKSITTNEYIRGVKQFNWSRFNKKLWQRNYYEHIIRDENSYLHLSEYIQNNPLKWHEDKYYG